MSEKKSDETVPGGRYILGDNYIDSEGTILGKVKDIDSKETKSVKASTSKDEVE